MKFYFVSIINYQLWATCCFLFVGRFACVGLPCSGNFARYAENCQTIDLDESARYLTMSVAHRFSLLFYFSHFLHRKSPFAIPIIISRYNASQTPVNCAGNVCLAYYFTHFLYCKAWSTASANRFKISLSTPTLLACSRELKSSRIRRQSTHVRPFPNPMMRPQISIFEEVFRAGVIDG